MLEQRTPSILYVFMDVSYKICGLRHAIGSRMLETHCAPSTAEVSCYVIVLRSL